MIVFEKINGAAESSCQLIRIDELYCWPIISIIYKRRFTRCPGYFLRRGDNIPIEFIHIRINYSRRLRILSLHNKIKTQ